MRTVGVYIEIVLLCTFFCETENVLFSFPQFSFLLVQYFLIFPFSDGPRHLCLIHDQMKPWVGSTIGLIFHPSPIQLVRLVAGWAGLM